MQGRYLAGVIIVILIAGGLYYFLPINKTIGEITTFEECAAAGYPIMESYPRQCRTEDRTFTELVSSGGTTTSSTGKDHLIRLTAPLPNAMVTSPLIIKGEARGNWYFEASFPAEVIDANGKRLALVPVQAKGEWMTTNFVPFETSITFAKPTTATGKLILHKDNASGLPEFDDKLEIPLQFASFEGSTQIRSVKIYTYNENLDKDAQGNVLCSAKGLTAQTRTIPFSSTPIQDALRELLKTDSKFSGVTLTGATLKNGTLTIELSDPQNRTSGGSCKVSVLRAQLEATAKQFPEVTSVAYRPNEVLQP